MHRASYPACASLMSARSIGRVPTEFRGRGALGLMVTGFARERTERMLGCVAWNANLRDLTRLIALCASLMSARSIGRLPTEFRGRGALGLMVTGFARERTERTLGCVAWNANLRDLTRLIALAKNATSKRPVTVTYSQTTLDGKSPMPHTFSHAFTASCTLTVVRYSCVRAGSSATSSTNRSQSGFD